MLVKDLVSRVGDDGNNTYVITYYNNAGVEIDSKSDFVEFVIEMFGDWNLADTDSVWIGFEDGRNKLRLYVEKPE